MNGSLAEIYIRSERPSVFSRMLDAQMKPSAMKCRSPLLGVVRVLKGFRWMSKEPAEIFERAADDGFVEQARRLTNCIHYLYQLFGEQLKHHSIVSQYGQLSGALALDGKAIRKHFVEILHGEAR